MAKSVSTASAAQSYTKRGLALTPIREGTKAPYLPNWQKGGVKPSHWQKQPNDGIGVLLEHSRLVSLDLDDLEAASIALDSIGISLPDLLSAGDRMQVQGNPDNKGKLLYRLPDGVEPPPTQKLQTRDKRMVFELRCKGAQDVLPPSIHPDTQAPYRFVHTSPNHEPPPLPSLLLDLSQRWSELEKVMRIAVAFQRTQAQQAEPPQAELTTTSSTPLIPLDTTPDNRNGHEFDQLRAEIHSSLPVGEYLTSIGPQHTPNNKGMARCILHDDNEPSLKVDSEGKWHCFACDVGGDVIDLHQQHKGLKTPGRAAVDLANSLGLAIPQHPKTRTQPPPATQNVKSGTGAVLSDPIYISPALAFVGEHALVGRNIRREKIAEQGDGIVPYMVDEPALIRSDRRLIEPPEKKTKRAGEILPLGDGYYLPKPVGDMPQRWSIGSINRFLSDTDTGAPDLASLYSRIVDSFKRWCYFEEEYNYHVLSLHVLGSYFHPLWGAYPYVNLNGPKGSGKSTVGAVAEQIGFNGIQLIDPSAASLFRQIELHSPYLVIDEAENVKSRTDAENNHSLMSVLKSGYQRGARISRQNQKSIDKTEYFSVYSPKLICNVHGNEDILQDRSIAVISARAPRGAVQRDRPSNHGAHFQEIRDELYLLTMHRHQEISHIISDDVGNAEDNRLGELSKPLIDLAYWVDGSQTGAVSNEVQRAIRYQQAARLYNNALTTEGQLLASCWRLLGVYDEREVTPQEIIFEMRVENPNLNISPHWVGKVLGSHRIVDASQKTRKGSGKVLTYTLLRERLERIDPPEESPTGGGSFS